MDITHLVDIHTQDSDLQVIFLLSKISGAVGMWIVISSILCREIIVVSVFLIGIVLEENRIITLIIQPIKDLLQ